LQKVKEKVFGNYRTTIMAKPIFILRCPSVNYMTERGQTLFREQQQKLQEKLSDYHVLSLIDGTVVEHQIEVFNVIDATDIEIEELKQKVLDDLSIWDNTLLDGLEDLDDKYSK
jgi:hypothetical protein